ncbi:hypothetical protein PTSG_08308 [Salpingoeca rosetta]|uniref:Sugar phosphate transporter domain-containing protein n=1 Tax=Salpingoeca rosetta (strain ATCC 50818 / BSB-021) TaxID=946362 RepID=F2UJB7_SALR5|nr:uncharacterized protein PTSG_08308 [Salpingoeca rosetta]EGD77216.1 hypothetical protein PTSG_08308 [Salpingoeca rosetta]|eukprot:XP_004990560.1 hypothetical protein PTSG_08308 [Salpingoeca rosetta]
MGVGNMAKAKTSGVNLSNGGASNNGQQTQHRMAGILTGDMSAGSSKKQATSSVLAILTYCLCSMTMIFTNKLVLAEHDFSYPSVLLLFQSAVAVVILKLLSVGQVIELERFSMATVRRWAPVTVFFGLMLYTGSKTLVFLSIPIVTVFKNMTNLLIAYGDWHFFGQTVTRGVIVSFMLMVVGSILTGFTDLEFNLQGYVWMSLNCLSQASYVLYARYAKTTTQLSEWGMSFYNNLLCVVLMSASSVFTGELFQAMEFKNLTAPSFVVSVVLSGVVGTGLSFAVFWVMSTTSPTTYSMVGSLNKIPITFASVLFFHMNMTWKTMVSIAVGLGAGIVYTHAKIQMKRQREAQRVSS